MCNSRGSSPGAAGFPSRRAPRFPGREPRGPCGSVPGPDPGPEPCCGLTLVAPEVATGPGAPHACSGLHRGLVELREELYLWNTDWYLTTVHYKMMMHIRHCCYLTPLCFK